MASSPPISHVSDSENSRSSFDSLSYIGGDSSSVLKAKDVCEELLGNKMIAIELNEGTRSCVKDIHHYDGSDSGLDIASTLNLCLKRALSSNSGDYASSNGGLDIESNINDNNSCGSSMISCASDLGGENKSLNTTFSQKFNCEYCSENGSESSLITNEDKLKKPNSIKKKIGMFEPASLKTVWKAESSTISTAGQLNKVKSRLTTISQTKSGCPQLLSREGARPREKVEKSLSEAVSKSNTTSSRSTPQRRTPKPNSLPCTLTSTLTLQRCSQRTPSVTRARTPGTPSDDGRWPSVGSKITAMGISAKRGSSVTPDLGSIKIRGQTSLDSKGLLSSGNCSNTLPRRRKQKSVEDLRDRASRSSSNSRDNGMVSSITVSSRKSIMSAYCTPSKIGSYRKTTSKTRIFHEMGVQTVITGQDVEKSFTGDLCRCVQIHSVQLMEKQTQSEIRDMEVEYLREEVQRLLRKQSEISSKLEEKTQKISQLEQQISKEREEKISIQRELNQNTERVVGMLELAKINPSAEESCDSLMMLESQIQMSGHELVEKTQEVFKLRKLCRTLQIELERALTAQECLIQEKNSIEREAIEMQDFLQHEKTAMYDALNESESEYQQCKKKLIEKEEEIKVLRDECRHLVRLNEQRRQENKLMQSKYTVLESKSKELRHHQNSAVSGASMALSGLYTRLDNLVEQLISSYNISEQDLEDIVYHNEAYPNSASSCDDTPDYENNTDGTKTEQNDGSLSPQRNQSFIAAVISAIRNATVPSGKKFRSFNTKPAENINGEESDSTEMLDSETEPCLMMDNVLEDVTMPDSHSHNLVSSTGIAISQIELPPDLVHVGDESLHNLSQAITNRQQIELEINSTGANAIAQFGKNVESSLCEDISFHESVAEMPSIVEYCSTQALIDQVIGVDNLITKLLKVLRLIQMDNDVCIQQLIVDKNKLQQNKEDMLEKLKDLQDVNIKLQDEIMDATQELMLKRNDLSTTKADIQRHRNEIDRLNEDICQLSTLCSQNNSQCNSLDQDVTPEGLLRLLRTWNEQGYFAETNIKHFLTTLCIENFKESSITYDSQQKSNNVLDENSVQEIRRQYETIDNALNILYKLQNIVQDNPTLQQLQNDLEKANNQSTNKLSLYSAVIRSSPNTSQDLINANDSEVILENCCCDNLENQMQINSPV